ncbi:MAG: lytic transglycosylase domain-containing protein [Rhodospirillaceae bacterium]|nr:lytic transglycosylase domain-containing protein [Rhodospirillaceae bacterium]
MTSLRTTPILAAIAALAGIAATATDALALSRAEIKQIVITEAMNSPVPPSLALAVAKIESDFNARALSTAGARGVMQIMPATARGVFGVGKDELWNARLNVQLGIDYLARLHRQYGGRWDLALSHYNGGTLAGHGAKAVAHPYTRKYVQMVLNWRQRYREQSQVWMVAAKVKEKTDGWQAARTRPSNVKPANRPARRFADARSARKYFERDRPWRRRAHRRSYYRDNLPAVLGPNTGNAGRWVQDHHAKTITEDSWANVFERRLRNRHRLDDFTPRRYRRNG